MAILPSSSVHFSIFAASESFSDSHGHWELGLGSESWGSLSCFAVIPPGGVTDWDRRGGRLGSDRILSSLDVVGVGSWIGVGG